MVTFSQRILMVGLGGVARCTLPILLRHIDVDAAASGFDVHLRA